MSMFVADKHYLVKDPQTRTIGEGATAKTIVTLTVADNPRGERAKARYTPLFIDADFVGRDGDFAATLKKGAAVAFAGRMGIRVFEKRDGTMGFQGEISYPYYLTAVGGEPAAGEEPKSDIVESSKPRPAAGTKKPAVDPFA